jgi:hypothetical protein
MNNLRLLIDDADLEITHDSGSRISIELAAGQGVIELHDHRLLRVAVKNLVAGRRQRRPLSAYVPLVQQFKGRIELTVGGRCIAHLDTSQKADFICRRLGLPYCRIRPFAALMSLLSP